MFKKVFSIVLCCLVLLSFNVRATVIVDIELQLLADVSGSVDNTEYALQLGGYSAAFRDPSVIAAIESGAFGSIAVQYAEWSGASQQAVLVDWTLITDAASSNAFADLLDNVARAFSGSTGIGSAIDWGYGLFANDFDSARQVIDVSGDGTQNTGSNTANARDAALAAGIDTINGITIGDSSGLQDFYINNVIGGFGAFHVHAASFQDFNAAIIDKVKREVASSTIPEPSSLELLLLALVGISRRFAK